jgi:uncharacterized protein (TIGR00369 family)
MTAKHDEHPERAFIRQIIESRARDVPVNTNPLATSLGMYIVEAEAGRVVARYTADERFSQGNGFIQGGIISAMLDFGMVFAAFSKIPPAATIATVCQTTNYLSPARVGDFVVEASLEKVGRNMIYARATIADPDGKQVASAISPIAVIAQRAGYSGQ